MPPRASIPPPGSDADDGHDGSTTGPLLLWLAIQLFAVVAAVARVPLAAGYPVTGELYTAQVLVVTQVTASALLFPYLLRSTPAAVAAIATAWPFVVLAGVMSAAPAARVAAAGCYVSAWLVALWAWNAAGRGAGRHFAVGAASLLTVGTLILFYLRLEFAPDGVGDVSAVAREWAIASPPLAALLQLAERSDARQWCVPAAVLGAACARGSFVRRRRQVIHSR